MIASFRCIALLSLLPLLSQAANSKGKDSPVVVGTIASVSADGRTITVNQARNIERKLVLGSGVEAEYVGIPDPAQRKPMPGYGVKAHVTPGGSEGDVAKSIRLTQPLTPPKPLGPQRLRMTGAQLHAAADANHDGKLSYLEYAASIFRSEKHGPDHFSKGDANHDGALSTPELTAMLPSVDWWKFSRKTPAEWIKAADKDGDGKINVTEFEALTSSKNHVEAFFARADKDKSGALDASEVAAYLKGVIERLEDEE
jgi:hypothetical protein